VYCLLLQVESCGQCTPCREGTGWLYDILTRMTRGEAALHEVNMLVSTVDKVSPRSSWTDISLGLGGSIGKESHGVHTPGMASFISNPWAALMRGVEDPTAVPKVLC
jgi:hypothetical protein